MREQNSKGMRACLGHPEQGIMEKPSSPSPHATDLCHALGPGPLSGDSREGHAVPHGLAPWPCPGSPSSPSLWPRPSCPAMANIYQQRCCPGARHKQTLNLITGRGEIKCPTIRNQICTTLYHKHHACRIVLYMLPLSYILILDKQNKAIE